MHVLSQGGMSMTWWYAASQHSCDSVKQPKWQLAVSLHWASQSRNDAAVFTSPPPPPRSHGGFGATAPRAMTFTIARRACCAALLPSTPSAAKPLRHRLPAGEGTVPGAHAHDAAPAPGATRPGAQA